MGNDLVTKRCDSTGDREASQLPTILCLTVRALGSARPDPCFGTATPRVAEVDHSGAGAETGPPVSTSRAPSWYRPPERSRGGRYDRCAQAPEIPKWNQMFRPTIEALRALGGSGTIQEINEKAIELEGYTDEQLAVCTVTVRSPRSSTGLLGQGRT